LYPASPFEGKQGAIAFLRAGFRDKIGAQLHFLNPSTRRSRHERGTTARA
jgi:hypothetical protein